MGNLLALLKAINQLIATRYALKYQPLTVKQCNACIVVGLLIMAAGGSVMFLLDNSSARDVYCFPLEATISGWKLAFYSLYFVGMLLIIVFITAIYVLIANHVRRSNTRITSTINFETNYRNLIRNTSLTVFMECLTLTMYFIAAVCHTINSIDRQYRMFLIMAAIFVGSSLHPVHYLIQEFSKHRKTKQTVE